MRRRRPTALVIALLLRWRALVVIPLRRRPATVVIIALLLRRLRVAVLITLLLRRRAATLVVAPAVGIIITLALVRVALLRRAAIVVTPIIVAAAIIAATVVSATPIVVALWRRPAIIVRSRLAAVLIVATATRIRAAVTAHTRKLVADDVLRLVEGHLSSAVRPNHVEPFAWALRARMRACKIRKSEREAAHKSGAFRVEHKGATKSHRGDT